MSSATAWDLLETDPARVPSRPRSTRRGHLRLVPSADAATSVPAAVFGSRAARAGAHITRRGRLTITLAVTVATATLALALASGAFAGAPPSQQTVTVSAGQTLSEVALAQLPRLPMEEGVARLQLANNLTSQDVHAGQVLRIPALD